MVTSSCPAIRSTAGAHTPGTPASPPRAARGLPPSPRGARRPPWLHQAVTVEGGRWYEAAGRLRPVSDVALARIRVAWYASEDASGAQLSTADSNELPGVGDAFAPVTTGAIRAPGDARSAQLRIMLRPAGEGPAVLLADDVSFARTAPPVPPPSVTAPGPSSPALEAIPTFFVALVNGDFELPGKDPYGWRAHAGAVFASTDGDSRTVTLTSRGRSTAWLHQSFAVEADRWYEASGRLRTVSNASLARIRVAWYASGDASGAQLATTDSDELLGVSDSFASVSTGAIRAPEDARSAQLRIMLRPAGSAAATLQADDVSFARIAPPAPASTATAPEASSATPEAAPVFFATLTNGDFELPGEAPYGWRTHAADAQITTEDGARVAALTSRGDSTAWLHQSFAIEGGRWYEASGRLRAVSNASSARIRVAWYASDDASGAQLSTTDSGELGGVSDAFASVTTGAIRAPEDARSAQLRVMLRPAGETPAVLLADDLSFARTAPPPAPADTPAVAPSPTPEATPAFFAVLTNGDFELPGETPYGWRAHAGTAIATTEGGSRAAALTSDGGSIAWLHQSFAVEGGGWYEAGGAAVARGQRGPRPHSRRLVRLGGHERGSALHSRLRRSRWCRRCLRHRLQRRDPRAPSRPAARSCGSCCVPPARRPRSCAPTTCPSPRPPRRSPRRRPRRLRRPPKRLPPRPGQHPRHKRRPRPRRWSPTTLAAPRQSCCVSRNCCPTRCRAAPTPSTSGSRWATSGWSRSRSAGCSWPTTARGSRCPPSRCRPPGRSSSRGPLAEIGDAIALRHSRGLFNGLGNGGDRLALATEDGAIIDALSYGSDDSVDQPPLKAPAPGRSLQRRFDPAGRLMEAAVSEHPSPGRLEAPATAEPAAPDGGPVATAEPAAPPAPATTSAAAGEVVDAATLAPPSSVEALRKQLDDTADWNRTAWIVLVAIAAVALVAAGAHRARELLRAPPPARRAAAPRRKRRWRRYASGLQVRRRREPNRRQ